MVGYIEFDLRLNLMGIICCDLNYLGQQYIAMFRPLMCLKINLVITQSAYLNEIKININH